VQAQDTGAQRIILEKAEELIIRLERISLPVIAGVNGVAAGAGTALAMACDLAIASKMATFAPNFVSIGAVPDSGVSWYLPRRIGRQKASELLLTGKRLSAEEAAELGLYASVVPMDDFRQALMAKARDIAHGPQRAVRSIKKLLKLSDWNTLEAQMEAEASLQMAAWSEADFAEGVQAFREGRPPRFGSSPYLD
jgi:2-(1,2-epoxy-1,2-dihydrophenyl)acetyl-CoA isomerase